MTGHLPPPSRPESPPTITSEDTSVTGLYRDNKLTPLHLPCPHSLKEGPHRDLTLIRRTTFPAPLTEGGPTQRPYTHKKDHLPCPHSLKEDPHRDLTLIRRTTFPAPHSLKEDPHRDLTLTRRTTFPAPYSLKEDPHRDLTLTRRTTFPAPNH